MLNLLLREKKLKESQTVPKTVKHDKVEPASIPKDKPEIQVFSKPKDSVNDCALSANYKVVPPSLDMKASAKDQRRIELKQVLKEHEAIAKKFNI